jgi:hypothetical protein
LPASARWSGSICTTALDANPILIYNNTFVPGGTWLRPRGILTARLFRISAEFNF